MGFLSVFQTKLTAAKKLAEKDVDTLLRYTGLRWSHDEVEPELAFPFGFRPVKLHALKLDEDYKAMNARRRTLLEWLYFRKILGQAHCELPREQRRALRKRLGFIKKQKTEDKAVNAEAYELRPYDWSVPMGMQRLPGGGIIDYF
jgi:hypothetical protein